MKLVKIIYKLRLSDDDKLREHFLKPARCVCVCAKSYIFLDIMLGKCSSYTSTRYIIWICLDVCTHCTAWHTVPTNHKSFYSLLTLCASARESDYEHEKTYTPNNRRRKEKSKTKSKDQLETRNHIPAHTFRQPIPCGNKHTHTLTHSILIT